MACRSRVCCRTVLQAKRVHVGPTRATSPQTKCGEWLRGHADHWKRLQLHSTRLSWTSSGRGGCETRGGAQTAGEIQDLLRAGDAFAKIESVSSCKFRKAACKPKPNNAELMESPYSFTLRQVTRFGKNFNAPLVLQGSVTLLQHRNGIRSQSPATLRRPRPPWRRASCARATTGPGKPCAASANRIVSRH